MVITRCLNCDHLVVGHLVEGQLLVTLSFRLIKVHFDSSYNYSEIVEFMSDLKAI